MKCQRSPIKKKCPKDSPFLSKMSDGKTDCCYKLTRDPNYKSARVKTTLKNRLKQIKELKKDIASKEQVISNLTISCDELENIDNIDLKKRLSYCLNKVKKCDENCRRKVEEEKKKYEKEKTVLIDKYRAAKRSDDDNLNEVREKTGKQIVELLRERDSKLETQKLSLMKKYTDEISTMRHEFEAKMANQIDPIQQELNATRNTILRLRQEVLKLNRYYANSKNFEDMNRDLKLCREKMTYLRDKLQRQVNLSNRNKELSRIIDRETNRRERCERDINRLEREVNIHQNVIKEITLESQEKKDMIHRLNTKIKSLNGVSQHSSEQEEKIKLRYDRLTDMELKISNLNQLISIKDMNYDKHKAQRKDLVKRLQILSITNNKLNIDLDESIRLLNIKQKKIHELKDSLRGVSIEKLDKHDVKVEAFDLVKIEDNIELASQYELQNLKEEHERAQKRHISVTMDLIREKMLDNDRINDLEFKLKRAHQEYHSKIEELTMRKDMYKNQLDIVAEKRDELKMYQNKYDKLKKKYRELKNVDTQLSDTQNRLAQMYDENITAYEIRIKMLHRMLDAKNN